MLTHELKRPELINYKQLYTLAYAGLNGGTAFIAKQGDNPVGALGAILLPNLFNPEIKNLAEVFWYVLPEYRKTRAGYLLLKAVDDKAKEIADETTLSLLPTSDVAISTLKKRGYNLEEYGFRKTYRGE